MSTPNLKIAEMDREIERLTSAVECERAQTGEVVRDLRVKLRHNRIISNAVRSVTGLDVPGDIILLPSPDRFQP